MLVGGVEARSRGAVEAAHAAAAVEAHSRGAAEAVAELAAGSSPEGAERNVPAEATVEGAGGHGWGRRRGKGKGGRRRMPAKRREEGGWSEEKSKMMTYGPHQLVVCIESDIENGWMRRN